jgi:hypothetical protein
MKSIVLPAGTEHVPFGELAHRIADALWPDAGPDDNRLRYASTVTKIKAELIRAVNSGALPVKDPDTRGEHTFPMGDALNRALVTVVDLREFVAGRGLSVLFQFTVDEDGVTTSFNATQAQGNEILAEKKARQRERQAEGHFTMYEAAEVLTAANDIGHTTNFLNKRMLPAVHSGALLLLDPIDRGPVTGRQPRFTDWVTPAAIDEWLERDGYPYRWPMAATEPKAETPEDETETLDYSLLATREQLLDAFKKWGLKPSWFAELNGHKWLLDARRIKGQGQRGNVIEPMFCPFAVMNGLIENVRKVTRLKPDTAWRVLAHKFPKVHAEYESYAPSEQTGD